MKVFQMNDSEWWVGETAEACEAAALQAYGETIVEEGDPPTELSDQDMKRLMFTDDDGTKRTFAEQLSRDLDEGGAFPRAFASSEY